jgi:hypothetical protein
MRSSRAIRSYFQILEILSFGKVTGDLRSTFTIAKIGRPTAKYYPVNDLK